MGLVLTQGQSSTRREIFTARHTLEDFTAAEMSTGFRRAAACGDLPLCTTLRRERMEWGRLSVLWPWARTACCLAQLREADISVLTLQFANARGMKFRSTGLAWAQMVLSPLAE